MALPNAYLTSSKNLLGILNAIKNAQAPETFSQSFLGSLDFKSSSDRLVIGVLKALGFLDESGKPTQRYFDFLDQTQSGRVLAEGVRDAYSDLFQVNINADKMEKPDLINKFKTLSQGQLTASVLDKMAMTFRALVDNADFESVPRTAPTPPFPPVAEVPEPKKHELEDVHKMKLQGLVYNIQIVLPDTRDPAVYDAIFRALKTHLA